MEQLGYIRRQPDSALYGLAPSIQLLQKSKVVFKLDNARFYAFYADLLTSPVPVKVSGPPGR